MIIRLHLSVLLVIQALALLAISATAQCPTFTEGTTPGSTKLNTVKSQMWFNDGLWWGAFSDDDSGTHLYSFSGNTANKGALIDADTDGLPDVLWDGSNLFVVIRKSTTLATLYKYGYDTNTDNYSLISGFPVNLPLIGKPTSAVVLGKDSTGKLWATYTGTEGPLSDGKVRVIWSASADHTEWETDGYILASGLDPEHSESSSIVHFEGDKIGIVWSDQSAEEIGFRYHIDGEPESSWVEKEIIDSGLGPRGLGPVANDQFNLKAAPDGRLFLVIKDNDNNDLPGPFAEGQVWLYIRTTSGTWGQKTLVQQDSSHRPTRPILLLDVTNNVAYVIYHDESPTGIERNFITQSSMDNPSFDFPCIFTNTPATSPTSTKQNLTYSTGLTAAGSTGDPNSQIVFRSLELQTPLPSLSGISPQSALVGGSSVVVTVHGTGFINGSVVQFNGSDRNTTFVSSTELTVVITPADLQNAGIFSITVVNPAPGGGSSAGANFTVNNLVPTLGSLSQNSTAAGSAAFTLTVHGTNFVNSSVVRFNGSDRNTTFVSSTELTAVITAADLQTAGGFIITVANPAPGGGTSSGLNFTVNNLVPTLSSLSQNSVSAGAAAFTLTVQGTNFVSGSVVRLNGSDRTTSFVSGTELTAQITLADLQTAGVSTISVANPAPGGGSSSGLNFTVNNLLPTLTGLSQNSASAGSATFTLTVHGTNFVNGSVVRLNGNNRTTTFVSSTNVTAEITLADLQTAGLFTITVANPAPGGGTSSGLNFTVNNLLPTLTSLSRTSAVTGESAFLLTVNGSNFIDGSVVRFNGTDRTTSFVNSTKLTALIPLTDLQAAGVFGITVANPAPGGGSSSGINFTVNNLLPTLTSLSQNSAAVGAAAFTLTVQGTNFVNGSVVRFNGTSRITTFVSSTQLTAQITLADMQAAGVFGITVVNPAPGGGTSGGLNFTVNNLLPTLTSLSQNSASAGAAAFTLTVQGTNFVNGSVVRFNGSDRFTSFVSGAQLTAQVTLADLQAAGVFGITVANPAPGGGSSSGLNFTVNNLLPTLTSLSQNSASTGAAAFTLTVQGTNFVNGSVVRFNGTGRTTAFVSSTQLTAQITLADLQAAGVFGITIANPAPGGGNSAGLNFTVNNLLPTLTSLSQNSASAGAAAFTLTVQGTNFVNGSVVRFNGSDRFTSFVSGTQLTAQITLADLQAAGVFGITVANPAPGGGSSSGLNFTVNNLLPTLTSLSQNSAAVGAAAFTLTVQGTNFVNGSTVRFNGTSRITTFVSSTQLTAQITLADLQAAGVFGITVANPTPGGGNSSGLNFTVNNLLPTLTSLSQNSVSAGAAAFTLTVQGTNFVNGSVVRFNGSDRTTSFVSGTQLTAQITLADLQAAGLFPITVANPAPGGGASSGLTFTINNLLPTLTSLSQNSTSTGAAAFTLTVQGTNFVNGSVVRFNGSDRSTSFVSATQLTAQITLADLQTAGVFGITVANPAPGGGSSSGLNFTVNNQLPTLVSLSQNSAAVGDPAFNVTVHGTNFVNGSVARFNGNNRNTSFVSSTELTVQITLADLQTAGVFPVIVTNPAPGGGSSPTGLNFTVNNLLPTLTSLSQTSASAGAAAFTLTVHGTNFVNGSVVRINGSNRNTSFGSSTELTAQITLTDLQAAGVFPITVANPAPGGGSSTGLNFTVNNLLPTLSSLSQNSVSTGAAAFTLTVRGTNFVSSSVVRFNGSDRNTSFVSGTELTAQVTLADLQAAGVFPITVANPTPGGGSSASLMFTVNNLSPTLTSLSQTSAGAGNAAFTLTVHGSNFLSGSVVCFNGSDRNTTFVSATELTAQITLADLQAAGVFGITVANPAPGGGSSGALNFTVNNLLPTLSSLSHNNAAAGDEGFALTVLGSNFVNGSVVRFNGSDRVTSFVSSTQLAAQITLADLQNAGVFAITVANPTPGGGSSAGLDFTVNNLVPTISSLSQNTAEVGDVAFTLSIFGSNFFSGSVVRFNGSDQTTTFVSSSKLTVQVTAADLHAAGIVTITVANPAPGGGTSSSINLTINNLTPTLSSLSQNSVTAGDAGFTLTVRGTNFVTSSVVRFNGSDRATTFISSTELLAVINAADIQSVGTFSVRVFNPLPGGGQSGALDLTVNQPPAKIQFEVTNYSVDEGSDNVVITVMRTGDSSQPVTVDFATDDSSIFMPCVTPVGAASQRCDYVTTGGTLSFASGETSKSFSVLLYEDVYLEGNETFSISLSNSVGATLGPQPTLTVTIQDNDFVAPFYNPINEPHFFARRHYLDLLNRLPDQGGLDYWAYQIIQCAGDEACTQELRTRVSAAFFIELEFQQTGYVVYRLYKAGFGQNPSYQRFMRDRGQLVVGSQLQATTNQYAERFVSRPEFLQEYPANMAPRDFVNRLFDVAGLISHDTERELEIDAMTNSGKTRAQVMLDVIDIQEFSQREFNRAFVLMQYFGYLRRDPDQGGYDYWLNVLNNREPDNYRGMVCAFITSREYQERTSPVLKTSNRNCGQ